MKWKRDRLRSFRLFFPTTPTLQSRRRLSMFERYTEKARRSIFLPATKRPNSRRPTSRPNISCSGSVASGLRKGQFSISSYAHKSSESCVKTPCCVAPRSRPRLTSRSAIQARSFLISADEASIGHRHIGTEHLLLALLRETDTPAERALSRHGITLNGARNQFSNAMEHSLARMKLGETRVEKLATMRAHWF